MNTKSKIALAVVAGVALGAAAMQGLHAQAKPKAYAVTETEVLDAAAQAAYTPLVRAAIQAAGARSVSRPGGRIVAIEGRRLPSVLASPSGTAWSRRRHSTTRKPTRTLRRSVTRLSRQYGGTSSKPGIKAHSGEMESERAACSVCSLPPCGGGWGGGWWRSLAMLVPISRPLSIPL